MKTCLLRDIYHVVAPEVPPTLPEYVIAILLHPKFFDFPCNLEVLRVYIHQNYDRNPFSQWGAFTYCMMKLQNKPSLLMQLQVPVLQL
jgi:hypothetical protein